MTALLVQDAVFAKLTGDSTLMSLITGVHDAIAPQDSAFPYITFDAQNIEDIGNKTHDHIQIDFFIDVWSRQHGRGECLQIQERVRELLHNQNLVPSSGSVFLMQCEYSETIIDPDGKTVHGIQRFNIRFSY